jgi:lysophospholipase L1-like esterase
MLLQLSPPLLKLSDSDLVIDGNSLFNYLLQPANASIYATLGASDRSKINLAVGGQTSAQMLADAATQVDPLLRADRKILIAWELTNSLYFGATPTQAQQDFEAYCSARKLAGWKIVVLTTLPRNQAPTVGTIAQYNSNLDIVNSWLRSNYKRFADSLVDVRLIPHLLDATNAAIFYDGIHLSALGYSYLIPAINAGIRRIKR